jgi:hypothetical protein
MRRIGRDTRNPDQLEQAIEACIELAIHMGENALELF